MRRNQEKSRKIVKTELEQVTSVNEDGVILGEEYKIKNTTQIVGTEPPYIKVYLQDLSRINDLGKYDNSVLHEIFKLTQYNTNLVTLNKYFREQICQALNTTDATVRNTISKLSKKGILIKKGTGVYMLNPNLFGNGTWENIKGLRMTIEYTEQGRTVSVAEVEKEPVIKEVVR